MASVKQEGGTVMVAVSKHSSSISALKWALSNKVVGQGSTLKLVHVRPPLRTIPTPTGNLVPIDKVSLDMVATYMRDLQSRTEHYLQAHRRLCETWKVQAELVVVENDDVVSSLLDQISRYRIKTFIIGTSNDNVFVRKLKGPSIPEIITKRAPQMCTVFLISKGKLVSVREASQSICSSCFSTETSQSECTFTDVSRGTFSSSDSSGGSYTSLRPDDKRNLKKFLRYDSIPRQQRENAGTTSQPLWFQRDKAASQMNLRHDRSVNTGSIERNLPPGCHVFYSPFWSRNTSLRDEEPGQPQRTRCHTNKELSYDFPGTNSLVQKQPGRCYDKEKVAPNRTSSSTCKTTAVLPALGKEAANKKDHVFVVEQAVTQDVENTSNQASTEDLSIQGRKSNEALLALGAARSPAKEESQPCIHAEDQANEAASDRREVLLALWQAKTRYREYTFEELKVATDGFSESNRIGLGGYGPVYKGMLHHTSVAIKVLNKESVQGPKEFQREVEFLSRMHHPHIVLLLGACPEQGCLVYEYLANGSVEDRLLCKGNTAPLAWHSRFRIAAEVATALLFLHSWKPNPYVHRDLKPANVLLDQNCTSKLGDVGLATLAPPNFSYSVTEYIETHPVGTFAYIDPEYQRTGAFTPRSDVYAFGLVMLQLLTGKGPLGLTAIVEVALNDKTLHQVLDPTAGHWPMDEAIELAVIALNCSEMKRRNRPDLDKIVPLLERLRACADDYVAGMAPRIQNICGKEQGVPSYFFCPISKEIMEDPHIAADGFTYEYAVIRQWLQDHKTSPVTNQKLLDKQLIPNHSLHLAILEWKQRVQDA